MLTVPLVMEVTSEKEETQSDPAVSIPGEKSHTPLSTGDQLLTSWSPFISDYIYGCGVSSHHCNAFKASCNEMGGRVGEGRKPAEMVRVVKSCQASKLLYRIYHRHRNIVGKIVQFHETFPPKFTGRRAQIISHDHTPHLECSDCHYQTLVECVPLSTKHFSSVQCSLSSTFTAQTPVQVVQVAVKNMLVLRWSQRHIGQRAHQSPQRAYQSPQRAHQSPERAHQSPQRAQCPLEKAQQNPDFSVVLFGSSRNCFVELLGLFLRNLSETL